MIDRKRFFDYSRQHVFAGSMTDSQVAGTNVTLDEWERRQLVDLRWLADMLATKRWETAGTMQPVRETMAATDAQARRNLAGVWYAAVDPVTGQVYYGRGDVQLTHERNYLNMTRLLGGRFGVDLVRDPDKALVPEIACAIMFEGMMRADSHVGDFTGLALEDFFTSTKTDWIGARKIINGTDHDADIANIAIDFYAALTGKDEKPRPFLMYGSRGPEVFTLQAALKIAGFYNADVDDDFGSLTRAAVIAFQASRGVTADGIVGDTTRSLLNI